MMETKLWTALRCAVLLLLLSYLGSAEHDNDHTAAAAPGAKVATEAPAVDSLSTSILEPTSHPAPALNGSDTEPSPNGTGSLSTSQSPEPKTDNDTRVSPSATATPKTDLNHTEEATSRPQILPSEGQTTNDTTHIPSTTPTIPTTNTSSPPHTAHNAPVDTQTNNTSNYTSPLPPDSISTSKQPTEPRAHSSTSAPEPDATTPATTITTTITQSTSTSSSTTGSCSSQKTQIADSQTLTSPHTSQSHTPQDQAKPSSAPSSSPSAQAKAHPDTPSQLNVGGDTTMVHDSPTLDPLLAGLVTAFIITAVVITLLLFLKLRKRDNRPEFRRLQDLPMDDMMEDTPLSMYSY